MICAKCNNEISQGDSFCHQCGASVSRSEQEQTASPGQNKATLVLKGIGYFFLFWIWAAIFSPLINDAIRDLIVRQGEFWAFIAAIFQSAISMLGAIPLFMFLVKNKIPPFRTRKQPELQREAKAFEDLEPKLDVNEAKETSQTTGASGTMPTKSTWLLKYFYGYLFFFVLYPVLGLIFSPGVWRMNTDSLAFFIGVLTSMAFTFSLCPGLFVAGWYYWLSRNPQKSFTVYLATGSICALVMTLLSNMAGI